MQLQSIILTATALFASSLAAPAPAKDVSMMAAAATPQWTIKSFTRSCNSADTSCAISYSIDTHTAAATACKYTATGKPASRASYNNIHCGAYTISSAWSGQFGNGNGFSTLAVVKGKTIVYPAYTDKQLVNGKVVSPDQSYTPQNLP